MRSSGHGKTKSQHYRITYLTANGESRAFETFAPDRAVAVATFKAAVCEVWTEASVRRANGGRFFNVPRS